MEEKIPQNRKMLMFFPYTSFVLLVQPISRKVAVYPLALKIGFGCCCFILSIFDRECCVK